MHWRCTSWLKMLTNAGRLKVSLFSPIQTRRTKQLLLRYLPSHSLDSTEKVLTDTRACVYISGSRLHDLENIAVILEYRGLGTVPRAPADTPKCVIIDKVAVQASGTAYFFKTMLGRNHDCKRRRATLLFHTRR